MGFLLRRLLMFVGPVLWRKLRERRQRKKEQ